MNPIGKKARHGGADPGDPDRAHRPHSIRIDGTNRFVFVPHLGTSQTPPVRARQESGKLSANTPPVVQMKQGTGPRHFIFSNHNKFPNLLNELTATVTTLALDAKTGTLKELDSASALPPDTKLGPGAPRGAKARARRNTDNDGRVSDLHLMPMGRFQNAGARARRARSAVSRSMPRPASCPER